MNQPQQTSSGRPGSCRRPWFDRFDALMTLDFSQNLRSADQFSEAKQTQPAHLQHHPACQSSILLLYDTLSDSITIYHFSSCCSRLPTLCFILRRKSTGAQYSWRNFIFQNLQTFNGDTPQGKYASSCMMLQRWRHLPNHLRFGNPFLDLFICSVATIYDTSECVCIARHCSSDTLWNASAKTIHYPCPRHSRCLVCDNHCMRETNIIKNNTCACRIRQGPLHCTYKYRSMFVASLCEQICCRNEFGAMCIINFHMGLLACRIIVWLSYPRLTIIGTSPVIWPF